MAARKTKSEGRPRGSRNMKRDPLFAKGLEGSLEFCELVRRLSMLGRDENEIAAILGISESKLTILKRRHPELRAAFRAGRDLSLAPVVAGLFEIAQRRTVQRRKPLVVDKHVEVVEWSEVVEADFRAASHVLATKCPEIWALRNSSNSDSEDWQAADRALDALLADPRNTGVVTLLGKDTVRKMLRHGSDKE
jgi:hypothetical protein